MLLKLYTLYYSVRLY